MTARSIGEVLALREARRGDKVRRHSFDVDDKRADVFRPIGDGSVPGALRWIDSLIQAIEEWNIHEFHRGRHSPIPDKWIRILKCTLRSPGLDFRTGVLEPSLKEIALRAGVCKDTVVRALRGFRSLGVIDWVRRTVRTGNAPGEGPQREQTTNAYFFPLGSMPRRMLRRMTELLRRKRLRPQNAAASSDQKADRSDYAAGPSGSLTANLRGSLDALARALDRKECESDVQSVYPSP